MGWGGVGKWERKSECGRPPPRPSPQGGGGSGSCPLDAHVSGSDGDVDAEHRLAIAPLSALVAEASEFVNCVTDANDEP